MSIPTLRLLMITGGLTALAACSGGRPHLNHTPPPRVAPAVSETETVFDLLMAGKEADARKLLDKLLKREPTSATLQMLSDSLKREPQELLGPTNYPYSVRAGDTIVGVAQRFLGNRLKAYQLLRYNGLRAPSVLIPGQVLRIPGEPPRSEPVRRPAPPAPSRSAPATPSAPPKPRPAAPKPAAAASTGNPAAARAARAAGLAALNGGDLARSIGLLRRAAALDPRNPTILRDLARAERIAATVRARK